MLNDSDICGKTSEGSEELRTRARRLTPRLRTMLIMVDSLASVSQLRASGQALGAPPDALDDLLRRGLIGLLRQFPQTIVPTTPNAASAVAIAASDVGADTAAPALASERFRVAQKFMIDTVVDALGLRSFFITLKLERCFNCADLKAMLPDYVKGVSKGSGPDVAKVLEQRLLELLR